MSGSGPWRCQSASPRSPSCWANGDVMARPAARDRRYAVGIVTATVFTRLWPADDPSVRLADALAAGLARAPARLHEVTAAHGAARFEPPRGDAPISSPFSTDLQPLDRLPPQGR